jgi:DNA (cytosine-5)-methyltransferase 1
MKKVLNLYAGIGGNRKLWENVEVTAVEIDPQIAKIYQDFFPNDRVIMKDAHQYLLEHYDEFDFIWASPPCPTHSKVRFANQIQNKPIYPDMSLYQEILFLKHYFKGKWVVENVVSFYKPLIEPQEISQHYYWSNFLICDIKKEFRGMGKYENLQDLYKLKGFDLSEVNGIDKMKTIRNCVEPKFALHVFNSAFREKQLELDSYL